MKKKKLSIIPDFYLMSGEVSNIVFFFQNGVPSFLNLPMRNSITHSEKTVKETGPDGPSPLFRFNQIFSLIPARISSETTGYIFFLIQAFHTLKKLLCFPVAPVNGHVPLPSFCLWK